MLGAGLGLSGLGGLDEKKAEAGIVISGDPAADQRAKNNGFGYSVAGGGNVAANLLDFEAPTLNLSP